jgi:hypothetical protein
VSDILETDVSSGLSWEPKQKEIDCVGVEGIVDGVADGDFFFFNTLLTVLLNVVIESVSLKNPNEDPSLTGISN